MIRPSKTAALAGVLALTLGVGGCALLSSPDPVQLYRFGMDMDAAPATPQPAGDPVPVLLRPVEFPLSSRGDRILGVTGQETAYIAGARWVSPANGLYSNSLQDAFADRATGVRLVDPREATTAARTLDIEVQAFEARYAAPGAVPEVVITARARMSRYPERTLVEETAFTVRQPASENRLSAIVQAFDLATRDLNTRIIDWTARTATTG